MGQVRLNQAGGWSFVVRTNDHPPPHVHVFLGGRTCRIALGQAKRQAPFMLPWASPRKTTMKPKECAEALRLAGRHQATLLKEWERLHGPVG